jgi:cation:H+ antiporter
MFLFLNIVTLFILFLILGFFADTFATASKKLADQLCLPIFTVGIIFGFITTLPETSIGLSAIQNDLSSIAFGNLIGGILVILFLIIGISAITQKQIPTKQIKYSLFPYLITLLLPSILILDGKLSVIDSLIIISTFLATTVYQYKKSKQLGFCFPKFNKTDVTKEIFFILISIFFIVLIPNWILEITSEILAKYEFNQLLIGSVLFSIGTNLPEIAITFSGIKKKSADFSISYLMSAALAHIPIIALLSLIGTISLNIDSNFLILNAFLIIGLLLLNSFIKSNSSISRTEGIALTFIYFGFILTTAILAI